MMTSGPLVPQSSTDGTISSGPGNPVISGTTLNSLIPQIKIGLEEGFLWTDGKRIERILDLISKYEWQAAGKEGETALANRPAFSGKTKEMLVRVSDLARQHTALSQLGEAFQNLEAADRVTVETANLPDALRNLTNQWKDLRAVRSAMEASGKIPPDGRHLKGSFSRLLKGAGGGDVEKFLQVQQRLAVELFLGGHLRAALDLLPLPPNGSPAHAGAQLRHLKALILDEGKVTTPSQGSLRNGKSPARHGLPEGLKPFFPAGPSGNWGGSSAPIGGDLPPLDESQWLQVMVSRAAAKLKDCLPAAERTWKVEAFNLIHWSHHLIHWSHRVPCDEDEAKKGRDSRTARH
jgi:hypothetical protein